MRDLFISNKQLDIIPHNDQFDNTDYLYTINNEVLFLSNIILNITQDYILFGQLHKRFPIIHLLLIIWGIWMNEFIYSGRHTYIHFMTLSLFVIYNMQCIRRNGIREKSNNACRVPPLIYINRATGRQSMPTIIDAYIMTSSTSSMSKNTLSIALRDHEINSILQVGLTFLLSCVP